MISSYDVINVANSINMEINEEIIAEALYQFESCADGEPHSTWDLIVERILYEIKSEI